MSTDANTTGGAWKPITPGSWKYKGKEVTVPGSNILLNQESGKTPARWNGWIRYKVKPADGSPEYYTEPKFVGTSK